MPASTSEIIVAFIAITIVLVLLVLFLISFAILFQRRQAQFRAEKQATAEAHAREQLQTQLETQNQTLQQIAEDIHDHVGQLLSLMTLQLQVLADEVRDLPALTRVEAVQESLRTTLSDVRDLTKMLHTDTVRQFGLHHCLKQDLDRITRTRRYRATFVSTGTRYDLGTDTDILVYRMAQESLTNAIKHARCKTITLTTDYQPNQFTLTVQDDGTGFTPIIGQNNSPQTNGLGLANLYRRSALLGGQCRIVSQPGQGTCIEIVLPHA